MCLTAPKMYGTKQFAETVRDFFGEFMNSCLFTDKKNDGVMFKQTCLNMTQVKWKNKKNLYGFINHIDL